MRQRPILRDSVEHTGYRVAIVTLDSHTAGPAARVLPRLEVDFPGLSVSVHAAAEWGESPALLDEARDAIAHADIIVANILFLEEHVQAILPDLIARRDACDALVGVIADEQIVNLTKMGNVDMSKPASGMMAVLKKLKPKTKKKSSGESQMKRGGFVPPRHADHDGRHRAASACCACGHRGPADAALLCSGVRYRPLRRRHPRV